MMRQCVILGTLVLIGLLAVEPASAAGWGNLTGKVLYDGTPPVPPPADITKDQDYCGRHKVVDESLLVGADGGVQNVVIYLYPKRGGPNPPVHPDYEKTASDKVKLDNNGCRFDPHIVLLRTSQTLLIGNSDPIGHNTKIDCFVNPPINPLVPAGGSMEQKFAAVERLPVRVSCNIHPWMNGWLVVRDNPYMAVTDEQGQFTIKNVPAGTWTFQVWHEKSGYLQQVTVNGKATRWSRGRVDVTIADGKTTDLGTIKVGPGIFSK